MKPNIRFHVQAGLLGTALLLGCHLGRAAESTLSNLPPPVNLTAAADHARTMKLLGITALRPGRNCSNTNSPNYANYNEAKANPFPTLPDPLTLKNGAKVTTAEVWWNQRRPELVEEFDREIYGRVPKETPKVNWEITSTTRETNGQIPVFTRQLVGRVDNSGYPHISVS